MGAIPIGRFVQRLRSAAAAEMGGIDAPLIVVALDDPEFAVTPAVIARFAALPALVVGVGEGSTPVVDTVVTSAELDAVRETVAAAPRAAIALALLLRDAPARSTEAGLVAESAVYSTLQAGPEFAAWRAQRGAKSLRPDSSEAVHVSRDGDVLDVVLARPAVHNALNTRMRDELHDAFMLAASDPSLHVRLRGEGPSFCAGGDLDEFGSFPDPATAHVVRLQRSVGRLIASIADRVEATVHGASVGSGIELAAFAGRVVARPDARFGLPELGLGLIPGAGGTVSLPRRIGRHRTARLALTGATIDASTAFEWGLVDEVARA